MESGRHLSAIMVLLLMPSLLLLAGRSPASSAASAGDDGGGGGGGNVRMERMDGEKCVLPIPLHLKVPHSYFAFIKLDPRHVGRGTSIHPLLGKHTTVNTFKGNVSCQGIGMPYF